MSDIEPVKRDDEKITVPRGSHTTKDFRVLVLL